MKKIIILLIIFVAFGAGLLIHRIYVDNSRRIEINMLLKKPKQDSKLSLKTQNSTISNNSINNIPGEKLNNSSYLVSNDFDTNTAEKADNSLNLISGLNSDTDNPYNNIENSADSKNNQVLLLAHLIESEAGNQSFIGKLAVGSVVMNREKGEKETLSNVIYQSGQFDGVNTKNFIKEPSQDSINAAEELLEGNNVLPTAYYFANLNLCSPDFAKESAFVIRIGDHWFFKK